MVQSFEIIAGGQKNPTMQKMLLDDPRPTSKAARRCTRRWASIPVQFDELYRNLVKAGEPAGVLETVLDTVATYKENTESLKRQDQEGAVLSGGGDRGRDHRQRDPADLRGAAVREVFQGFGADLPAFTQMIIGCRDFMIGYWWLVLGVVVGAVFAFIFFKKRSLAFAHFLDRMMLKIPVIGQILHNAAIARFARTLGVTFRPACRWSRRWIPWPAPPATSCTSRPCCGSATTSRSATGCNMAMKQVNLFPHMVVQMIAVGEEAGALDTMLFKVAEFYEEEVNNAVDALSSLLEPLIMVIIGVLVGGMVIAMYLPIFKLAAVDLTAARRMSFLDQNPGLGYPAAAGFGLAGRQLPQRRDPAPAQAAGMGWKRDSREVLGEPELYDPPPPGIVVERSHCPHCKHAAVVVREHPAVQLAGAARPLPALPRADLDAVPAGRTADDAAGGGCACGASASAGRASARSC